MLKFKKVANIGIIHGNEKLRPWKCHRQPGKSEPGKYFVFWSDYLEKLSLVKTKIPGSFRFQFNLVYLDRTFFAGHGLFVYFILQTVVAQASNFSKD